MSDESPVNTGGIRKPGTFVKGDKRINRKGRPRTFDALRKLAIKIAGETIDNPNGEDYTRIEAMLRVLTSSKNPADRALFLAYAFGKPKDEVDVTSGGEKIGANDSDTRAEILRKLDSIAAGISAGSVPVQPDADPVTNAEIRLDVLGAPETETT